MSASNDKDDKYGFFGWKEILSVRNDLLREFDSAKEKNQSRRVRTSHGNAGEAEIRRWLAKFLPKKFAVTSGYIIPSTIHGDYELKHFDVIIYDQLAAPVLWIDGDEDMSEQGKSLAIPAQFVHAIYEVKASLTKKSCDDVVAKLNEIDGFKDELIEHFTCGGIYFDYAHTLIDKPNVFQSYGTARKIRGFDNSLILRCSGASNTSLTGRLEVVDQTGLTNGDPFFIDVDQLEYAVGMKDGKRGLAIGPSACAQIYYGGDAWHLRKKYISCCEHAGNTISIEWSYDMLAEFTSRLLHKLEGRDFDSERLYYGRIFHHVEDRGDDVPKRAVFLNFNGSKFGLLD